MFQQSAFVEQERLPNVLQRIDELIALVERFKVDKERVDTSRFEALLAELPDQGDVTVEKIAEILTDLFQASGLSEVLNGGLSQSVDDYLQEMELINEDLETTPDTVSPPSPDQYPNLITGEVVVTLMVFLGLLTELGVNAWQGKTVAETAGSFEFRLLLIYQVISGAMAFYRQYQILHSPLFDIES